MEAPNSHSNRLDSLDRQLSIILLLTLAATVILLSMANIQTDAIDYYAILQRLGNDQPPIVEKLPFLEQRSPGYPLSSLPLYHALALLDHWIGPQIVSAQLPAPSQEGAPRESERALLPPQPVRFREVFFKYYDLAPQGGMFKWNVIVAMLLTSYILFFSGLLATGQALQLLYPRPTGRSLPLIIAITSLVCLHNLVNTPGYATLAVFGISSLFTWCWIKAWQTGSGAAQRLAGALAGWMVVTRLETVLIVAVLVGLLMLWREFRWLRNLILGGLLPLAILMWYNTTQFGNPLHIAILKGDMNILSFNPSYIASVMIAPQSGILFWSTLTCLGVIGLICAPQRSLTALGWASIALAALIALRVPVMYTCVGQGTQVIAGLEITCPPDASAMLNLIRLDSNRYIIPLAPFAALGIRELLGKTSYFKLMQGEKHV